MALHETITKIANYRIVLFLYFILPHLAEDARKKKKIAFEKCNMYMITIFISLSILSDWLSVCQSACLFLLQAHRFFGEFLIKLPLQPFHMNSVFITFFLIPEVQTIFSYPRYYCIFVCIHNHFQVKRHKLGLTGKIVFEFNIT